jgi:hypothetical protein
MSLLFQPDDRVRLTREASAFYGFGANQGAGGVGTVLFAGPRPCPVPGGDPRPYRVEWDTGNTNTYREGDLEAAEDAMDSEDAPTNIIPFGRR